MSDLDWQDYLETVDPDFWLDDLRYQLTGDDFMSLAPVEREEEE